MAERKLPVQETNRQDTALAKDYLALLTSFGSLKDSRDHYAALYESAPAGYLVLDQKGHIKDINATGGRLLGARKTSARDMPLSAYILQTDIKEFLEHLRKCNKTARPVHTEVTLANRRREVQLSSVKIPVGGQILISTILVDETEKKKIEREVARLDRLYIIGEMAAGIAHEIRNPMTTVLGYLQLFQKKTQMADYRESFSLMVQELLRANTIITEFLSLARNRTFSPVYTDLNQILENIYPLINAEALLQGKTISIEPAASLPLVLVDENEIRQVVLNLTRNGLQAMNKGVVRIRTGVEQGCHPCRAGPGSGDAERGAGQDRHAFFYHQNRRHRSRAADMLQYCGPSRRKINLRYRQ
jgi:PAS domain S-box-containing protein